MLRCALTGGQQESRPGALRDPDAAPLEDPLAREYACRCRGPSLRRRFSTPAPPEPNFSPPPVPPDYRPRRSRRAFACTRSFFASSRWSAASSASPGPPPPAEHVEEQELEAERFRVGAESGAAPARPRSEGRRVVAVGTTCSRVLETRARRSELPAARSQGKPWVGAEGRRLGAGGFAPGVTSSRHRRAGRSTSASPAGFD
ncbi:MAG: S-adenosylmethionine:tRNA ribosyltransferase-isomerase [Planctomycetes bacterium]|nr:S-adenosylmethionine:tRNA ribosyltransferase-isomerase [Planctomycetota bacterium]